MSDARLSLSIAGTAIVPRGTLVIPTTPSVFTPFLVEALEASSVADLFWEAPSTSCGDPFGDVPAPRGLDFLRSDTGLWFRRGSALCRATPDLLSWHAWARDPGTAQGEMLDGRPWLMLAVWGLVAQNGGAFLHGGICVIGGKYFLLLGESGAGKSTLSRLVVDSGASCLTDENPFVTEDAGRLLVHGSPWPGLRGADVPLHGRLSGVFFLRHANSNVARQMSEAEAGLRLLDNARFFTFEPDFTPLTVAMLDRIATTVPVFDFGFVPTLPAVDVLRSCLAR